MTETALEKAKRKFEQARATLDAVKARETQKERKKDTRRKIVLGGALLELAKADKEVSALVSRLIAGLSRDHDKKLFEKNVTKGAAPQAPEAAKVDATDASPVAPTPEPQNAHHGVSAMPGYAQPFVRPDSAEI